MATFSQITSRVFMVTLVKAGGLLLTLGLISAQVAVFGTSPAADAFFFARRVLSGAASMIEGGLQKLFVPVFVRDWHHGGRPAALARMRRVGLWLAAASLGGALVLELLAAPVVRLMAPGFGPEQHALAVTLFRILLIGLPLAVFGVMLSSFQFSRRRFGKPALAALLPRAAGLLAFALFGYGLTVQGLSWALVAGMALMLAMLAWAARETLGKGGDAPPAGAVPKVPQGARAAAIVIFQGGQMALTWIDTAYASLAGPGGVAIMYLALRLLNAAPGTMNASVSTVYYTEYSHAALDARSSQAMHLAGGLRLSLFLVVPVAALLLAGAGPIIALLLERGALQSSDTAAIAAMTAWLAPTLLLNAAMAIFFTGMLADDRLPVLPVLALSTVLGLAARLAVAAALVPSLGLTGLALAIIVSSSVQVAVLGRALWSAYGAFLGRSELRPLALNVLAAAAAALVFVLAPGLPVLVLCAGFAAVYLGLGLAFGLPEVKVLFARLRRRR